MNASMVGEKASDLGPLRGLKAESGCFSTKGTLHATQELFLGPFGLKVPCMHVKVVTLHARTVLVA